MTFSSLQTVVARVEKLPVDFTIIMLLCGFNFYDESLFRGIPYLSGDDVTSFKGIHILVLLAMHYPLLCYIDTDDDGLVDRSCVYTIRLSPRCPDYHSVPFKCSHYVGVNISSLFTFTLFASGHTCTSCTV